MGEPISPRKTLKVMRSGWRKCILLWEKMSDCIFSFFVLVFFVWFFLHLECFVSSVLPRKVFGKILPSKDLFIHVNAFIKVQHEINTHTCVSACFGMKGY